EALGFRGRVDLAAALVEPQALEVGLAVAGELHRAVRVQVDRARIVRREQRGDDRALQARFRVLRVERLDHDLAGVEVDHRPAHVVLGVLHVRGTRRHLGFLLAPGAVDVAGEDADQALVVALDLADVVDQGLRIALVGRASLARDRPRRRSAIVGGRDLADRLRRRTVDDADRALGGIERLVELSATRAGEAERGCGDGLQGLSGAGNFGRPGRARSPASPATAASGA